MPKREEDPTLVGLVIAFDPEEEARRYEEEERLAKQKRKGSKHSSKKSKDRSGGDASSSSKCSGATGSTARTTSEESASTTAIPDKIVTTTMLREDCPSEEKKKKLSSSSSKKDKEKSSSHHHRKSKSSHGNKKKSFSSSSAARVEIRKCKSEKHLSKRDLKKMEKKEQKKLQKRQRIAAKTIQQLARGYLARKRGLQTEHGNLDEESQEVRADEEKRKVGLSSESSLPRTTSTNKNQSIPPTSRIGRIRRTISWSGGSNKDVATRQEQAAKEVAASSLQRAYRAHAVRRFWQKGDHEHDNEGDNKNNNNHQQQQRRQPREAFRKAWQNFFIFNVLSPMKTRLRRQQKAALMSGPKKDEEAGSDVDSDDSDCSSDSETAPFEPHVHPHSPLGRHSSPYLHQQHHHFSEDDSTTPDLLDAIPEDKTYSASRSVGCMLAPLPSFADSDDDSMSTDDELIAENITVPPSPSTVVTTSTASSFGPHKFIKSTALHKKTQGSSSSALHASCPNSRLESI